MLHFIPGNCSSNFPVELDKTPPFGNGPWQPGVLAASDLNKTYQFRVSSFSGTRCWGNITVKDFLAPQVSCPDIAVPCVIKDFTPSYFGRFFGY